MYQVTEHCIFDRLPIILFRSYSLTFSAHSSCNRSRGMPRVTTLQQIKSVSTGTEIRRSTPKLYTYHLKTIHEHSFS